MSIDSLLTDVCTIQYNSAAVAGDSGHSAPANWATLTDNVKCKLSGSSGAAEYYNDRLISVRTLKIFFLPETTITDQHRVLLNSKTYVVNGVDTPTANGAVKFKAATVTIAE